MIFTDADARPTGATTLTGRLSVARPARVGGRLRLLPALTGAVLSLAGCAGQIVPTMVFHDGPRDPEPLANAGSSRAVLLGERPIRRVGPSPDVWPNLATVPERPKNVDDPAPRQRDMTRLAADRAAAEKAAAALSTYRTSPDQLTVRRATNDDALTGGAPAKTGPAETDATKDRLPVVPAAPPPVPGRVPESVSDVPVAAPTTPAPISPKAGSATSSPTTDAATRDKQD